MAKKKLGDDTVVVEILRSYGVRNPNEHQLGSAEQIMRHGALSGDVAKLRKIANRLIDERPELLKGRSLDDCNVLIAGIAAYEHGKALLKKKNPAFGCRGSDEHRARQEQGLQGAGQGARAGKPGWSAAMTTEVQLNKEALAAVKWFVVAEYESNTWVEHYDRSRPEDDDPWGPAAKSPSFTGYESRHRMLDAAVNALGKYNHRNHCVAVLTEKGFIRTLARHLYLEDRAAYELQFEHSRFSDAVLAGEV